ncbi:alpha/beta hydrolase [Lentzea sp. NPDC051838]|uniref:alpha/beta fold hydrolase n=1 Tax=Lentzea sp. NPDC051838 TaxID=3154849 RepID=UPI003416235A
MGTFNSYDGTKLAFHGPSGSDPLICLPGGPMTASAYLAALPLDNLLRLDLRGTGESEEAPLETYRADRQVEDVEALRRHLGLEKIRLLGHSAGGSLAILYATRYPQHVEELVLIAPSPRVVGIDVTDDDRRTIAYSRSDEPWYPEAIKGFEQIWAGDATPEAFDTIAPFWRGRGADEVEDDHATNEVAAEQFYAEGALDPEATRAALKTLDVPTLLLFGEVDVAIPLNRAHEYAELLPHARLVIQAGAGHAPWLDDSEAFAGAVQRIP